MNKIKYIPWVVAAGFVASLAVILPVSAQTISANVSANVGTSGGWQSHDGSMGMHGGPNIAPGIFGTVTAINGDTLTVTSKPFMRPHMNATTTSNTTVATTVYTVDATNATVSKNGATSALSSVAVNDMVFVQGTISGTNVTATAIRDGAGSRVPGMGGGFGHGATSTTPHTPPTSLIQGNGEPVVGGSVTAINGDTLTVTNASNVTYAVDVTNATIVRSGVTSTIASIATGDNVVIQGTVNGTSITASSVIDQGTGMHATSTMANSGHPGGGFGGGIFSAIGGFFKHLFGF